jgi:hypothetical protein
VVGETDSTNFPTASPLQAANGGNFDAFITKLNATGSALLYSTYLGGSSGDSAIAIALDGAGNAYVAGTTDSTNFPTVSPIQAANGGVRDGFVAKLNAAGTGLLYSTYLGGNGFEQAESIAVDGAGNAYVAGFTESPNFPTTAGSFQTMYHGASDAFVTKITNIACTEDDDRDDHERHDARDDDERHDARDGDERRDERHKTKSHPCKGSGEMDSEKHDREKE